MDKTVEQIAPCPFCKCADVCLLEGASYEWGKWHYTNCKECDAQGPLKPSKEEAVAAWNQRTPVAAQTAVSEELSEAEIAVLWNAQRHYHGEQPLTMAHVAFYRAILAAQKGESQS